jgi:hypothetical protein
MKKITLLLCLLVNFCSFSQDEKEKPQIKKSRVSKARKIIENASISNINKDWSFEAKFEAPNGDEISFFPVQIVDLKTGETEEAFQVDIEVKAATAKGLGGLASAAGLAGVIAGSAMGSPELAASGASLTGLTMASLMANDGKITAWVDRSEVDELTAFLEKYVVPNLNQNLKDQSSEYIFASNELTLKYIAHDKKQKLTIVLNNANNFVFTTEKRVERIVDLVPMLKKVQAKEIKK